MENSLRLSVPTTNNEAGYEALLAQMTMVKKTWRQGRVGFLLRLIVGQVKGDFEARDRRMQWYLGEIRQL